jgi:hypothetical protein
VKLERFLATGSLEIGTEVIKIRETVDTDRNSFVVVDQKE